jgi:hypothetical protein
MTTDGIGEVTQDVTLLSLAAGRFACRVVIQRYLPFGLWKSFALRPDIV